MYEVPLRYFRRWVVSCTIQLTLFIFFRQSHSFTTQLAAFILWFAQTCLFNSRLCWNEMSNVFVQTSRLIDLVRETCILSGSSHPSSVKKFKLCSTCRTVWGFLTAPFKVINTAFFPDKDRAETLRLALALLSVAVLEDAAEFFHQSVYFSYPHARGHVHERKETKV